MISKHRRNKLKNEKSPYLLQHVSNPVYWYPWSEEAFEIANKENKPVFLSVGYSTCHWCHVMAHESFEDEEVARLMNDTFICIKVDREERADIDNVYMNVCHILTGSGGWPLTVIMTPDKKPFFAGTYFPKNSRYGRIGMTDLVMKIKTMWQTNQEELEKSADKITELINSEQNEISEDLAGEEAYSLAQAYFVRSFDKTLGGFGTAPKFPSAHNLSFLMHFWKKRSDNEALNMAELTLLKMKLGGIFDHIGFGFHRYSTDAFWRVPHFEKMLYDQASLSSVYSDAYQITGKDIYKITAEQIFDYVIRELTSAEGGFFSAEDADSEGVEGKFYLWGYDEFYKVLGKEEADLFTKIYNIKKDGNYTDEVHRTKTGKNILFLNRSFKDISEELKISYEELCKIIESARTKLFEYRSKRIHPLRDDKILIDWNGLMISAFSKGYQILHKKEYLKKAENAAVFILNNMIKTDGSLFHRYKDGDSRYDGILDDYAFLIQGLIDLYESGFDEKYLVAAIELNEYQIRHFWDNDKGGFYYTSKNSEKLIARQKMAYDSAIQSGNSAALSNLFRLFRITSDTKFEEYAIKQIKAFSYEINQTPAAYTQSLISLGYLLGDAYEIIISGKKDSEGTAAMIDEIRKKFIPNKIMIFIPADIDNPQIFKISKHYKEYKPVNNNPTVYICQNFKCRSPITDKNKISKNFN